MVRIPTLPRKFAYSQICAVTSGTQACRLGSNLRALGRGGPSLWTDLAGAPVGMTGTTIDNGASLERCIPHTCSLTNSSMRRRPGELLQLEQNILSAAHQIALDSASEAGWFHAYPLAKVLAAKDGDKSLLANGTIYRSLRGLADRNLLEQRVEDPGEASLHRGPPRRYFRITALGRSTLETSRRPLVLDSTTLRSIVPLAT
jgi:DNA-binding PadR family transcriptional regulator